MRIFDGFAIENPHYPGYLLRGLLKVNFYANFRQAVGAKTVEVELPDGSPIQELVSELIRQYPRLQSALLDESGGILPHVHVFINGRDTQYLPDGVGTALSAADKIDIFPPMAGG
jgi:sulfur-carrier protein